jgi:hypothetical protein
MQALNRKSSLQKHVFEPRSRKLDGFFASRSGLLAENLRMPEYDFLLFLFDKVEIKSQCL